MMNRKQFGRIWSRWKFQLSALVLIAPVTMVPSTLHDYSEMHDARVLPARAIGPWTVTLGEHSQGPPHRTRAGRWMQDYSASFCDGCMGEIRAAFIHVGERPSIDAPGAPLHGNPHHLEAHVEFPAAPEPSDSLWLTADGWDGQIHQISWALAWRGEGR